MSRHPQLSSDPTLNAKARSTREIIRRVAPYLRPYKGMFFATVGCAILSLLFSFAYPKLTQFIIDDVIVNKQATWLAPAMAGLLGAFVLRELFNSLRIRINNT